MKSTDVGLDIAADPAPAQKKVRLVNTKYPSSDFLYTSKKEERAQKVVAGMSLCVGRTTAHKLTYSSSRRLKWNCVGFTFEDVQKS